MQEFVNEKYSFGEIKKSPSVTLNNFGKLVGSSSMHQMGRSLQNSPRKSVPDISKISRIKIAAKEINEKEGKIYKQIKESLEKGGSAISVQSNINKANILYGNRWNKV